MYPVNIVICDMFLMNIDGETNAFAKLPALGGGWVWLMRCLRSQAARGNQIAVRTRIRQINNNGNERFVWLIRPTDLVYENKDSWYEQKSLVLNKN